MRRKSSGVTILLGVNPPHALVMLGNQTKPTIDLKGTASGPVCLAYQILSLVPPFPFSLVSFSFVSVSLLCLFSLSLSLSRARASVLVVFCVRRFDRFANGGHRGFKSRCSNFAKPYKRLITPFFFFFFLFFCIVFLLWKERKGKERKGR